MPFQLINFLDQNDKNKVIQYLAKNGFLYYEIDGVRIYDRQSFYDVAMEVLPQDPPLPRGGKVNLDGFTDSVTGGLMGLENQNENVAIIWNHADKMYSQSEQDVHVLVECFRHINLAVATTDYGIKTPIRLQIFLLGTGEHFPAM